MAGQRCDVCRRAGASHHVTGQDEDGNEVDPEPMWFCDRCIPKFLEFAKRLREEKGLGHQPITKIDEHGVTVF